MKSVDFSKTSFYKGLNATYGKTPVRMEVYLDFQRGHSETAENRCHRTDLRMASKPTPNLTSDFCPLTLKLGLFAGMDKLYRVNDIGHFLNALESLQPHYFSKNFILEPEKMYFEKGDKKLVEFLSSLRRKRKYDSPDSDAEMQGLHTGEAVLNEAESECLLDYIWDGIDTIRFCKPSDKFRFKNDIGIKVTIEKKEDLNVMTMDYSEHGDFEPLSADFRYIVFKDKWLIVKLPEAKMAVFADLYRFKNEENIVVFTIGKNEKKQFQKNFIDKYREELRISLDNAVQKELTDESLISRVYFDVAPKGIVSKIEFCYENRAINPLDDIEANNSFREFDSEKKVVSCLKDFGFKSRGRLFLLDDIEKIMFLLTDNLKELKKISEVYYSEDFKRLYVKNLSNLGLRLSEDCSVIHMNINLENVSDEELAELLEAVKKGKKYYRLRNGSIINLGSVESSRFVDLINSLDIDKSSINGGVFEIPLNRCLYIDNYLKEKGIDNVEMDSRLGSLIKSVSNPGDVEVVLDEALRGVLRNYQRTGVKWLKTMAGYSFGGILADDMGLGKTIQALAFIASERGQKLPCMVIAPTSIIYNWKREAEKFAPKLKALVVTGPKDKRTLQICCCNEHQLVITSYGALKNDIEDYKKVKFLYVFVDEAQNIKNPMTLNANSVKSLKAKCCFALTGTPIENRLTEMWSIFDFIMPGYLFDRNKFVNTYEEPIIRDKNSDKMDELSNMIKPFILRRLKKDVLNELPEKIETHYVSEMTDKQKKLYAAYYKDLKKELIDKIDECRIESNHIEILAALTRLRQICAHPGTFIDDYDGGSGKLDLAMEIITGSINSGHSILLFSQFTKMLKIIRNELNNNNISYYYIDGTMKPEERLMEIDNFNSDREAVFLISLKAGGTGLNLTKADIVIHFDPWWNPAVEDQASDRVHRIGQNKVVQVCKLLTEGTIEEKIFELQERKRDLIENIIKPGESFINRLSGEEIRELFGLDK